MEPQTPSKSPLPKIRTFATDQKRLKQPDALSTAPPPVPAAKPIPKARAARALPTVAREPVPAPIPKPVPAPIAKPVPPPAPIPKPVLPPLPTPAVADTAASTLTTPPAFHTLQKSTTVTKPVAPIPRKRPTNGVAIVADETEYADTTIIRDTVRRKPNVFWAIGTSIMNAGRDLKRIWSRANQPLYVVPETERRKGVIQQATSQTGKTFTADYDRLKERLRQRVQSGDQLLSDEDEEDDIVWTPHTEPGYPLLPSAATVSTITNVHVELKRSHLPPRTDTPVSAVPHAPVPPQSTPPVIPKPLPLPTPPPSTTRASAPTPQTRSVVPTTVSVPSHQTTTIPAIPKKPAPIPGPIFITPQDHAPTTTPAVPAPTRAVPPVVPPSHPITPPPSTIVSPTITKPQSVVPTTVSSPVAPRTPPVVPPPIHHEERLPESRTASPESDIPAVTTAPEAATTAWSNQAAATPLPADEVTTFTKAADTNVADVPIETAIQKQSLRPSQPSFTWTTNSLTISIVGGLAVCAVMVVAGLQVLEWRQPTPLPSTPVVEITTLTTRPLTKVAYRITDTKSLRTTLQDAISAGGLESAELIVVEPEGAVWTAAQLLTAENLSINPTFKAAVTELRWVVHNRKLIGMVFTFGNPTQIRGSLLGWEAQLGQEIDRLLPTNSSQKLLFTDQELRRTDVRVGNNDGVTYGLVTDRHGIIALSPSDFSTIAESITR